VVLVVLVVLVVSLTET